MTRAGAIRLAHAETLETDPPPSSRTGPARPCRIV